MLAIWASCVTSLCEITREDIQAALDDQPSGHSASAIGPAQPVWALKQERVIFREPTRGISLSAIRCLPIPIPPTRSAA